MGNADPKAVTLADSCWTLVERIGMPEARITLSQCATYLALAPKSNAAYAAIERALGDVKGNRVRPVPVYLRDPNSSAMPSDGQGRAVKLREHRSGGGPSYAYSHESDTEAAGMGITEQDYLGVDRRYYEPTDRGEEAELKRRLDEIRSARRELRGE